jgi:putative tributyrin esterase
MSHRLLVTALVLWAGPFSPRATLSSLLPQRSALGARRSVSSALSAQRSLTVVDSFWSQALGIRKHVVVWLPPSYAVQRERRYPVAYYLHGAFGDETNWTRLGHLDATLDSLTRTGMPEMIVVMPDGDDGFYTTWNFLGDYNECRRAHASGTNREPAATYCVPWPHYDDYIARDLVGYIDKTYRTIADRRHRGIAGLSMGGYGAVALALSYPDVFSAAASHSGVLAPLVGRRAQDDTSTRYRYNLDSLEASYGKGLWALLPEPFGRDTAAWLARDPARLAARLERERPSLRPSLHIDCGLDDPLLAQSRAFKASAQTLGWTIDYAEYPGAHTWDYWRRHSVESVQWLARLLTEGR